MDRYVATCVEFLVGADVGEWGEWMKGVVFAVLCAC